MFIKFIKNWQILLFFVITLIFFWQFFLKGLLPIPSDTIVGLYHPFRDYYAKDYPRGIPFKNFLISDPVRQIIPWKSLSIDLLSRFELPLWNPYEMAGKPHLANFQSSPLYPLNIILFIKPFHISWSVFIMIQPILAAIFMFSYLRNLRLDSRASVLGAVAFSFSGFSIAWFEWGNIIHTALWLPLILLCIDKIFEHSKQISNSKYQIANIPIRQAQGKHIKNKKFLIWFGILLFSSVSSFFAGHLQIFFYLSILSVAYFVFRWFENGIIFNILYVFLIFTILFLILTAVQWIPTLQFISLSARSLDQNYLDIEGWFIPWQHLVQFVIPDFFGNPATLNYWGTWNYTELVGYVGIVSLAFVILSLISGLNRNKLFFTSIIIIALLFATENSISKIPYEFNIPFISSSQPTRLIFLIVFGLSVLSAFGFDFLIRQKKIVKEISISLLILTGALGLIWVVGITNPFNISQENLSVLKRNLIFPSVVFGIGIILMIGFSMVKNNLAKRVALTGIILVVALDLLRFGWKFTPFTNAEYFYPKTRVIEFLKKDKDIFRIALTDSRIFPPNFSTYYRIQSIEGYDPLYLKSYAQVIAASERREPNISPPFGFNRIITPHNLDSKIIDLLNVKYVLSLSDLNSPKLVKVFQEGETRVYENKNVLPRVFFVEKIIQAEDSRTAVVIMFSEDLKNAVVVADYRLAQTKINKGNVRISRYSENNIILETNNDSDGFLILTDSYYPTWKVEIDGESSKIYKTNNAFRGVFVPKGEHIIVFYDTLF